MNLLDFARLCTLDTEDWDNSEDIIDTREVLELASVGRWTDKDIELCPKCIKAVDEADKFSFFYWLVRYIAPINNSKEEPF